MVELTEKNFNEEVANAPLMLVDFWASWCGPCRMMAPIVDGLEAKVPGLKVGKVNVDEEDDLAVRFKVQAIPFLAIFKNGKMVDNLIGLQDESELIKVINLHK